MIFKFSMFVYKGIVQMSFQHDSLVGHLPHLLILLPVDVGSGHVGAEG